MTFAPNTGYAFAVGTDIGIRPTGRTRGVDARQHPADLFRRCWRAPLKILRNRGERFGNFIGSEIRNRLR